jgi:hypothetical protein
MLRLRGVACEVIGRHGGGEPGGKLQASAERMVELSKRVSEEKPDRALTFCSPEGARVAFGLGIPHYCIGDSPHATAVCRLTVPLSHKLFTPWVIPKAAWRRYGISDRDIIRYRALDPISWMHDEKLESGSVDLSVPRDKRLLVIRLHEDQAAYSRNQTVDLETSMKAAQILLEKHPDLAVVVLARYNDQAGRMRKFAHSRMMIVDHVVDSLPLLRRAAAFIGSGGTMTTEAALLGVPTISCYPRQPTYVERFLVKAGLVRRALQAKEIVSFVQQVLVDESLSRKAKLRALRTRSSMKDPTRAIATRVVAGS